MVARAARSNGVGRLAPPAARAFQREREADFQATEAALRSEVQELTSDLAVARAVDDLGELVALFKRK